MFLFVCFGLLGIIQGIQVTPNPNSQSTGSPAGYRDYHQMTEFLSELSSNYSSLVTLQSIGRSVEERELWVMKIKSPNSPIVGAPNVKFVGNIHGNEPVGRELILQFAEYLVKNYETDDEVKWILDRTSIHLLPSLNPDGFERSKEGVCFSGPGRENGNFVDLNRNFPDHLKDNRIPVQPETLAVAQWMSQVPFVLSASFHGGALVANYPFDSSPGNDAQALMEEIMANITRGEHLMDIWRNLRPNGLSQYKFEENYELTNPGSLFSERELVSGHPSVTPDDDVFKYLAQTYANSHLTMHKGRTCNENQPSFPGGITNGAAWYSFTGGMQDYNYVSQGCMELTLEISCCKYPQASHLPRLWMENKMAMLELAKQSQMGVRGLIVDKVTSAYIPGATLLISGRNIPFTSSKNGEFWRILLPGRYLLIVEAKGYETQSFPFTVEKANVTHPISTWLNIYLQPSEVLLESASSNMAQVVECSGSAPSLPLPLSLCLPMVLFVFTRRRLS